MAIIRVFPRRTNATPDDEFSFVGEPPLFLPEDITEIHISVTFSWDIPEAERLARAWEVHGPIKMGGPALGMRGESFVPGRYLKPGYVITSRGCPNNCWFCSVPKREGNIRELPICMGWNVLDDNILACSEEHVKKVFRMLSFSDHPVEFTGGLEAARLKDWHAQELKKLKAKQVFFAYDSPEKFEALKNAAMIMFSAGFTRASKAVRSYVLIGYPKDTIIEAESRLNACLKIGVVPMAMLWKNEKGESSREWRRFQRLWARPMFMKFPE